MSAAAKDDGGRAAAAECIEVAARFLAAQPGAADRVLAAHRRAPDGRCTGCGSRRVRWPCSTAVIARRALGTTAPPPTAPPG